MTSLQVHNQIEAQIKIIDTLLTMYKNEPTGAVLKCNFHKWNNNIVEIKTVSNSHSNMHSLSNRRAIAIIA